MRNETARREREICAAGGVAFRRGGGEAYADKGDIPFKNFYGIVLQNRFTGSEILKKGEETLSVMETRVAPIFFAESA